jgi:hypothetical protein
MHAPILARGWLLARLALVPQLAFFLVSRYRLPASSFRLDLALFSAFQSRSV